MRSASGPITLRKWQHNPTFAYASQSATNNLAIPARQIEKAPDVEVRENLLRLISTHSPMSWAHINMLGEYDFSEEKLKDTLGILPPKKAA